MFNRSLMSNGYPINPTSFFIGIRREFLQNLDFVSILKSRGSVSIPVRFIGEWDNIRGVVKQVNHFIDGIVVIMNPLAPSLLENWKMITIWIPYEQTKSAGVMYY